MYILAGEIMAVSLHHFTFSETDCWQSKMSTFFLTNRNNSTFKKPLH